MPELFMAIVAVSLSDGQQTPATKPSDSHIHPAASARTPTGLQRSMGFDAINMQFLLDHMSKRKVNSQHKLKATI